MSFLGNCNSCGNDSCGNNSILWFLIIIVILFCGCGNGNGLLGGSCGNGSNDCGC